MSDVWFADIIRDSGKFPKEKCIHDEDAVFYVQVSYSDGRYIYASDPDSMSTKNQPCNKTI